MTVNAFALRVLLVGLVVLGTATAREPVALQPELRRAQSDWAQARRLVQVDPAWRQWAQVRHQAVEAWFRIERDPVEQVAGFPNDYVDPATGAALPRTPDAPEPTAAAPAAVRKGWVAVRRQANIAKVLEAARLQRLLDQPELAELAALQLDRYAENYGRWPLQQSNGRSRMLGQALDEAVSAFDLVEAVALLRDQVTEQRLRQWERALLRPMAENLKAYDSRVLNNVDLWCALASATIALALDDAPLLQRAFDDPVGVRAVMRAGLGPDGLWREASFPYQAYVLQAVARFADAAAALDRADAAAELLPAARRLLLSPLDWRFDDGSLPSPSDARFRMRAVDVAIHLALYRHTPTAIGLQAAQPERSWNTLLDPPAAPPPVELPPVRSRVAEDVRFAQLRRGPWQLFVHYGQSSASHAQEEALAYELGFGTEAVSRDAGTAPSYASPLHRDYFSLGVGNNVPLVNGAGQARPAPGELVVFKPAEGRLRARQPAYRPGMDVERGFELSDNAFRETTRFEPAGAAPAQRLGVVFNTDCRLDGDPAGAEPGAAVPQGSPGFGYWRGVRRWAGRQSWESTLQCGRQRFSLRIEADAEFEVWRAQAPSTPLPAQRETVYAEAQGGPVRFTTEIRRLEAQPER